MDEEEERYKKLAAAMAQSRRHTKYNVRLCVLAGWNHEEIMHWIETGQQPIDKPYVFNKVPIK